MPKFTVMHDDIEVSMDSLLWACAYITRTIKEMDAFEKAEYVCVGVIQDGAIQTFKYVDIYSMNRCEFTLITEEL